MRKFYSKPDYQALSAVNNRSYHFFITDEAGKDRAEKLLKEISASSQCVLVTDAKNVMLKGRTELVPFESLHEYLSKQLTDIPAGSQFYLFGKESFIWQVQSMLRQMHVADSLCTAERCGPIERDVFCVHCRQISRAVQYDQVSCSGCGSLLFVYDHFSKHHACYMGFKINAECEDEIPEAKVLSS